MEGPTEEAGRENFETGVFAELKEFLTSVETEDKEETAVEPAEEKAEVSVGAEPKEYIVPEKTEKHEDEELTLEAEVLVEPESAEAGVKIPAASEEENIFAESGVQPGGGSRARG
jgi:hypothetical protein